MPKKTVTMTDEQWCDLLDILSDNEYLNDLDKKYTEKVADLYQSIGKQVISGEIKRRKNEDGLRPFCKARRIFVDENEIYEREDCEGKLGINNDKVCSNLEWRKDN